MQITVKIEDTYSNGDSFERTMTEEVSDYDPSDDIDDWAYDNLFQLTGQGPQYSNVDGGHDVTVLECAENPDLVGKAFEFGY